MKKGGKDEGGKAAMEPLFPRLNVTDREKGGPRAPPRNKMALYEQLSIPSKRFNSPSASTCASSARPPSKDQADGHEKMVLSPFNMSPNPDSNSEDRVHSRLSDRASLNTTRTEFGRSFKRHASNNTVNARGLASPECNSRHLSDSAAKKCRESFEDEDDFRVPTFVHTEIAAISNSDLPAVQPGKPTISRVEGSKESCSYPLPTSNDKPFEGKDTNTTSRNYEQDHSEQNCRETSTFAHSPETPDRSFPELLNWGKSSLDRAGTVDVGKHTCDANKELRLESCDDGYPSGSRFSNRVDVVEEVDNSRYIIGSCSKASLGKKADKFDQDTHDGSNCQRQLEDGDRDEVSETSMDYVAGMMISPDDVVGVIGSKQFWKARRAIVNQQRVFAVQVFELHRLIKVQKLIAASPDAIMTDVYHLKPSSPKMVSENLQPEHIPEPPPPLDNIGSSHQPTIEQNDSSQKLYPSTGGCPEEYPVRDPTQREISRIGPHPVDLAPDNRTNAALRFHPPPNQWLVPVMSPSEGLIYKPYSGPCPPPIPGFMAPFYGGCTPMGSQPAAGGDFMSSAYGALPFQQPPNYFPSFYSHPMEKPVFSSPAVGKVTTPSAGSQTSRRELQQTRSSCVVSHPRSIEAISGGVRKLVAPKDSEIQQGSTMSSSNPREDERRPAVHKPRAFVATNQTTDSESCRHRDDGQNRVIKVVPHNAGSATESAARIFRSIQRERQHGYSGPYRGRGSSTSRDY